MQVSGPSLRHTLPPRPITLLINGLHASPAVIDAPRSVSFPRNNPRPLVAPTQRPMFSKHLANQHRFGRSRFALHAGRAPRRKVHRHGLLTLLFDEQVIEDLQFDVQHSERQRHHHVAGKVVEHALG